VNLFELAMWNKEIKGTVFDDEPAATFRFSVLPGGSAQARRAHHDPLYPDEINDGYEAMQGTNLRGVITTDLPTRPRRCAPCAGKSITKCQGHNRCYALAPELFDVDDYGIASELGDGTFRRSSRTRPAGGMNCPEFAISLPDVPRTRNARSVRLQELDQHL
jgi:ferredoxin